LPHNFLNSGSAAIYGLRGKKHVTCFILYPKGRVSLIQEQQMTTVPDENIHCLRIDGTFDDCQDIVKVVRKELCRHLSPSSSPHYLQDFSSGQ
jgi:threonine synthase